MQLEYRQPNQAFPFAVLSLVVVGSEWIFPHFRVTIDFVVHVLTVSPQKIPLLHPFHTKTKKTSFVDKSRYYEATHWMSKVWKQNILSLESHVRRYCV